MEIVNLEIRKQIFRDWLSEEINKGNIKIQDLNENTLENFLIPENWINSPIPCINPRKLNGNS